MERSFVQGAFPPASAVGAQAVGEHGAGDLVRRDGCEPPHGAAPGRVVGELDVVSEGDAPLDEAREPGPVVQAVGRSGCFGGEVAPPPRADPPGTEEQGEDVDRLLEGTHRCGGFHTGGYARAAQPVVPGPGPVLVGEPAALQGRGERGPHLVTPCPGLRPGGAAVGERRSEFLEYVPETEAGGRGPQPGVERVELHRGGGPRDRLAEQE